MAKNLVSGPTLGPPNFFPKIWLRKSLDIMVSYHHVQTNDPILRKHGDGWTDRWKDRRISDLIGHCPTNVERPKI